MDDYLKVCDRDLIPLPPPIKKNRELFNKYQTGEKQKITVKSVPNEKSTSEPKPAPVVKKIGGVFIY